MNDIYSISTNLFMTKLKKRIPSTLFHGVSTYGGGMANGQFRTPNIDQLACRWCDVYQCLLLLFVHCQELLY